MWKSVEVATAVTLFLPPHPRSGHVIAATGTIEDAHHKVAEVADRVTITGREVVQAVKDGAGTQTHTEEGRRGEGVDHVQAIHPRGASAACHPMSDVSDANLAIISLRQKASTALLKFPKKLHNRVFESRTVATCSNECLARVKNNRKCQ